MTTGATGFFFANLIILGIAALVLYTIIRLAVRNGIREATRDAIEKKELQLQIITDLLTALVKEKYKSG